MLIKMFSIFKVRKEVNIIEKKLDTDIFDIVWDYGGVSKCIHVPLLFLHHTNHEQNKKLYKPSHPENYSKDLKVNSYSFTTPKSGK